MSRQPKEPDGVSSAMRLGCAQLQRFVIKHPNHKYGSSITQTIMNKANLIEPDFKLMNRGEEVWPPAWETEKGRLRGFVMKVVNLRLPAAKTNSLSKLNQRTTRTRAITKSKLLTLPNEPFRDERYASPLGGFDKQGAIALRQRSLQYNEETRQWLVDSGRFLSELKADRIERSKRRQSGLV